MSVNDPQLKKLFKKAYPKQKPERVKNPKGSDQYLSKLDPDRYQVFREILLPNGEIHAVFFLVAIVIVSGIFFISLDAFGLALGIIIILMAFFRLGLHLYHYFIYRGSVARLPFPVSGWAVAVNRRTIISGLVWHNATLQIKLNNPTSTQYSSIQAALNIFMKKAKKKFYTPDVFGLDPRHDWEIIPEKTNADQITVGGSSNPEVIGTIYLLMRGNLTMLQKKFPGLIESVSLTYSDSYQEVDIDIPISAA